MKQQISIPDLGQLTTKARSRYLEESLKRGWKSITGETKWNIGQMIEFIGDSHNLNLSSWQDWEIEIDQGIGVDSESWSTIELCDGLWEAVKKILEYESQKEAVKE